ncbi:complement factor I [Elgaria multicarinata webbii]|uniref:complement factor I n=1 Tax=Elgaria multicarinata webbii TaxID=159646 RepID=UPI002FCD0E5D
MKLLLALGFSLCLSLRIWGEKNKSYLIEDCVSQRYTQNSCEKVHCQPWQRCVRGSCSCKLPYQCPKNASLVCSTEKMKFPNYCSLKSFECRHQRSKFLNRGSCNQQDSFQTFLDTGNTSSEEIGYKPSEGIVQVKVNQSHKTFICGHGWSIHEANVACRDLGYSHGADSTELVDLDNASYPLECLTATCRGIETTLAECALTTLNLADQKVAKVICHTLKRVCSGREFPCVNGKCIPSEKTCNGINDCGDLSDEVCCKGCQAGSFHCRSDVCIPETYRCNNEIDCLTGEDENRRYCNRRREQNERGDEIHEENKTEVIEKTEESMDEERKKMKALLPHLHCGIANRTITRRKRILGGYTAGKDEFPWQVAIRSENQRVNCGGVYIGGCWILTAAHCVRMSHMHLYRIWTGLLNTVAMNTGIETFLINKMIIHENYDSRTYENDIALLQLKPKDRINLTCSPPGSVPVCIPWSKYMFRNGYRCKVSGWGLDEGFTKQYALKWGYISIMENCSDIYKERYFEGMECAGTNDGSVDSCKGDSGGPMVCFDSNDVGYLWGIVSWGENCGEKGRPGVYTKVVHYFDWISRHTRMNFIS